MIKSLNSFKREYFDKGSVCVFGMRGRGKDMLMANVAVRNKNHISNVCYGQGFIPLDFNALDIKNKPTDMIEGHVTPYVYPYPEGVDIFISDIGIYFPSQYYDFFNRKYPTMASFLALSRQLGLANVHLNTQALNRPWDKFREQSDTYVLCRSCKVLFGGRLVLQRVTTYDRYEVACEQAEPFWYPPCEVMASKEERRLHRANKKLAHAKYRESHGRVKNYTLLYRNRSTYDTRYFKSLLGGDCQ